VPKLKFSADVAVHPKLSGTIRINIDRLLRLPDCDAKFGALLHLFRDFAEGDIPVGAGRSKGFGAFSLRLEDRREPGGNHLDFEQALRLILQKAEQIGSEKAAIAFSGTLEKEAHGWLNAFDSTPEKQTEWVHPEWWKPAATPQPQSLPEEPLPAKVLGRFNPYHWVPVAHSPNCLSINADSLSSKHTHRHDNYAADGYSGRITVRIRAVTPLFVGGLRERTPSERQAGLVKHYCVGGVPAIPSTSLRGLLSSTYEIATASAMRVLDANKIYSYRMPASSRFHSIGRVAEGGSKIIPWNQRPTGRQYTEGSGVPKQLKNLPVWNEIPQTDPLGTGQSVPDFYCLDFGGRHKHMPIGNNGRSHEICLTRPNSEPQRIEITGGALEQFYRIADERTKETKDESDPCPYEPQGQRPQGRKDDDLFYRLKDNDFVYFKAELVNGTLKAVHISLAQIWRDDVKKTIGEKLQSVGGDGVVPYCSTRKGLTLAERVFGFVQGDPSLNGGDEPGRDRPVAFASKLIVSDALLTKVPTNGIYLSKHAETLKILSSPKPPSPAFYFDPVSGHLPDYEQIKNGDSHPRGRKMYLHLHPESADKKPWLTKRPNYLADGSARLDQKVAIECLNKDSIFEFTIDFDNLTTAELAALCYSLRPKDRFMHKIGLAKPLGLGSIAFEVQRVEKIDRSRRYTSPGFAETRYCDIAETPVSWIAKRADAWKSYFLEKAPDCANSLTAFETIGTTAVDSLHYPLLRNQPDAEDELFKWPSENRQIASMPAMNGYSQFLRKVDADLSIDPLPWPCNILVLKGGANLAGSFIESLKNSCSGYVALTDATGAKGKIDEFRSKCAGCLTFVIGTITTLAGIVDEPSRVKRVQLADVAIQRPARNIEKRYWNDDHKTLSNLERALKLGAK
jgi:hypothetical protein